MFECCKGSGLINSGLISHRRKRHETKDVLQLLYVKDTYTYPKTFYKYLSLWNDPWFSGTGSVRWTSQVFSLPIWKGCRRSVSIFTKVNRIVVFAPSLIFYECWSKIHRSDFENTCTQTLYKFFELKVGESKIKERTNYIKLRQYQNIIC